MDEEGKEIRKKNVKLAVIIIPNKKQTSDTETDV